MSRGPLARVRRSVAGTPLRLRLVGVVLALVTLALAVTGAAATTALRGYLLDRVDRQLAATTRVMATRVEHGVPGFGERRARVDLPSAFFVQVTGEDGVPRGQLSAPLPNASHPVLPLLDATAVRARAGAAFTVPGSDGGTDWRVLAVPLAADVGSVAVAVSLADVQSTVARLVVIDVVVRLGALGVLAVLGYAVVRSNLRPLVAVESTAAAIAAGDLTRRVPESDARTKVGRLARALNTMLGQIESAFRARSASEAAARASEDRMRRFVADASHELRTPLTSIRGFAELYRQGAAEARDDVASLMRRIEDEAARMGLLVEDLLLLARLDQQRPLDRRPVDLLAVAADAVHDARVLAPAHAVELRLDPSAGPPVVLGDEGRLRQVVANLLTNATTHTPGGTHVTVTVGSDGGRCAVLDVADDGPGMTDEDAARAFERFYRADPSRTRRQGGSGLGLAIVAALVAAHDGSVDLDTAPGSGTTVRVRLPLRDGHAETPRDHAPCFQAPSRSAAHADGEALPDGSAES